MQLNEIRIVYRNPVTPEHTRCTSSEITYQILQPLFEDIQIYESFYVLFLDSSNHLKGYSRVSTGGLTGTMADLRMVFAMALKSLATAIIIAHNHPSCNLQPSASDRSLTRKMVDAGKFLDILVLDHLIVSEFGYFSFADEGLL